MTFHLELWKQWLKLKLLHIDAVRERETKWGRGRECETNDGKYQMLNAYKHDDVGMVCERPSF